MDTILTGLKDILTKFWMAGGTVRSSPNSLSSSRGILVETTLNYIFRKNYWDVEVASSRRGHLGTTLSGHPGITQVSVIPGSSVRQYPITWTYYCDYFISYFKYYCRKPGLSCLGDATSTSWETTDGFIFISYNHI
jgi:hypothetical protein